MVCPVELMVPGVKFGRTVTVQVPDDTVGVVLQVLSLAYLRYEVVVVSPDGGVYVAEVAPEMAVA